MVERCTDVTPVFFDEGIDPLTPHSPTSQTQCRKWSATQRDYELEFLFCLIRLIHFLLVLPPVFFPALLHFLELASTISATDPYFQKHGVLEVITLVTKFH